MTVQVPQLDDRGYAEILNEAMARLSVSNPEYTARGPADPGITLLQLFAFMVETLQYRANRIPERNLKKFMQLLGLSGRPAEPARGIVTFSDRKGELQLLSPGQPLRAGELPFQTTSEVEVLPLDGYFVYKARLTKAERDAALSRYVEHYQHLAAGDASALEPYQARPLEAPPPGRPLPRFDLATDTVDESLWLALLAPAGHTAEEIRGIVGGRWLSVGVLPATDLDPARVRVGPGSDGGFRPAPLLFEAPDESDPPRYRRLETRAQVDLLSTPGILAVRLPASEGLATFPDLDLLKEGTGDYPPPLEDALKPRLVTWLRLRLDRAVELKKSLDAVFGWLGINAATIRQGERVEAERLGIADGKPDQSFKLARAPIALDDLVVTVNGIPWKMVDDVRAAPPEAPSLAVDRDAWPSRTAASLPAGTPRLSLAPGLPEPSQQLSAGRSLLEGALGPRSAEVFSVDAQTGRVSFGSGLAGSRPPASAEVRASYSSVAGARGRVAAAKVQGRPPLARSLSVTNPIATWGGADAETTDELERRIPLELARRERLVSKQDFDQALAATPGVRVARHDVLPTFHPEYVGMVVPGAVTLLVVPEEQGEAAAPPIPDRHFLEAVCKYVEPRRLLTTELFVVGPAYVAISLSIGVGVLPGAELAETHEAVKQRVRAFLSPVRGGFIGSGWPLRHAIDPLEIAAVVARVPGVARVNGVLLRGDDGATAAETIPLDGVQLPRLATFGVAEGDPLPFESLTDGQSVPGLDQPIFPIPIVVEEC